MTCPLTHELSGLASHNTTRATSSTVPTLFCTGLLGDVVEHVALHGAGGDAVDRRAAAAELPGPDARQALQRRLGRAVQPEPREPLAAADGADVDDASVGGREAREEGLGEQQWRAHVDVVDLCEVGGGNGAQGRVNLRAGVVDEDVDAGGGPSQASKAERTADGAASEERSALQETAEGLWGREVIWEMRASTLEALESEV
ncbi:uncharacterized protein ColSpa_07685 [Colletotrichum spaethianum]|uniref:Uncharacterized protein n=1 Tax=Colletotrichum spaethianum TaxID=700344 RepID=A0AA37UI78_9PEZI|nr:uncharacterized protein ColSpa_07685 [Colletotrichum spaethianum]GKT47504.1 hypothetical protein ColSpa_07685 [Colletotrichum spaethianum]